MDDDTYPLGIRFDFHEGKNSLFPWDGRRDKKVVINNVDNDKGWTITKYMISHDFPWFTRIL